MPKPYAELRNLMRERKVTQERIAIWIDRSETHVNYLLSGRADWTAGQMYIIMNKLNVPHRKMHLLFPPEGRYAGSLKDPEPSKADKMTQAISEYIKEAIRCA